MENNKINIAEILKLCPSGMELDCPLFEDVYFDHIDSVNNTIKCYIQDSTNGKIGLSFNEYGQYTSISQAKCVIFPKGTTWEQFEPPCKFKDGENDIIKDDMEAITIDDFKANTKEWLIDKLHNMIISDAIKTISNIHDELHKPQYPKTYKECCDVLGLSTMDNDAKGYKDILIIQFQELLIARDAYWKIANWKPDWEDCRKHKYTIHVHCDDYVFWQDSSHYRWLSFPTKEMRDAFYENFKDLINECKEFL